MKIVKMRNDPITPEFLKFRADVTKNAGYSKPRWIEFSETLLERGYILKIYEAKRTVSKYITISNDKGKSFKVRFSNHLPIKARELEGDCDYFVGVTNLRTTNYRMALMAVNEFFGAP